MKKLILASLIASASMVASAQVTMSGKVSVWQDNTKLGNNRANSQMVEPTSNFAINVSEKLANGMTARAVVETSLEGNTLGGNGTQLGDRQATVGLAGGMGSLDLGRNVHSHFLAITNNDSFGTLYGSVAGDVHNLRGLRMTDGAYVTVTPMKGLSVSADHSNNVNGLDVTTGSISASLGPVGATVAQFVSGDEKSTVVGLQGKVMNAAVFYSHSVNKGLVDSKGDLIGARYTMGAITAKASWGKNDADLKAWAVGADYALSKRTDVGVAYRNLDRTGTVTDVAQVGVGLTHRF